MKIIGIIPVRNEEWIIRQNLQVLTEVCNIIIVGDQDSTDQTVEICHEFPKVHLVDNSDRLPTYAYDPNVLTTRQRLLDAARCYDGHNIILYVDADEILSANVLGNEAWRSYLDALSPGEALSIPFVWIWGTPRHYVSDRSVWANLWIVCAFRDDRISDFEVGSLHEPHIPQKLNANPRKLKDVKLLHYAQMPQNRWESRQCFAMMLELIHGKPPGQVNKEYVITMASKSMILAPVPPEWIEPWIDMGIELEHVDDPETNWFDLEVLKLFSHYGIERFSDLNIWHLDWESKRNKIETQGKDNYIDSKIIDPRTREQKVYHAYLNRFFRIPPWRDPLEFVRLPIRWSRSALRATGLRRKNLIRLGLLKPSSRS